MVSLITTIGTILAVAYFNFLPIQNQFLGDLSQNMGSIEISYIQMAKFWVEGGGRWQPLWYLGYPWHVFYIPVFPALEVLLHFLAGYSFGHAYRVITALAYILVPVSLFFFVWQISKSRAGALVAALFYSFVPSVISLIFAEVAADTVTGLPEPRRFAILVRWGEGPHTLSLVFLPIFGLYLSRYLGKKKFADLVFASLFLGLLVLTNAIGVWTGAFLMAAMLLGEAMNTKSNSITLLKDILLVCLVALGLVGFWYNLPFMGTFFREGGGVISHWQAIFPWKFIFVVLGGVGFFWLVKKFTGKFEGLPFSIFWFTGFFAVVYIYYASGEDMLELVPQALRLTTEVDMSLSVLVGAVVSNVFLFLVKRKGVFKLPATTAALLVVALPLAGVWFFARSFIPAASKGALPLTATEIGSVENTNEYKVSKTLEKLVTGTDQRVFVPGNLGFWLNYFVDVPQIRGALYQSSTHDWSEHIYWQVTNGSDGQIALAWLKIVNIGKLVYGHEVFGDYKVPQSKFEGVLKKEQEIEGNVYFSVPLKSDSLAKIVDPNDVLAIKKPDNAIDEEPIFGYVQELEKYDEKLKVDKISKSHLRVSGKISEGQGVLVQQTYDSGWRANGWKVKRDNFDFMVLVPSKNVSGDFSFDLVYNKPLSVYLGYLVTILTLGWIGRQIYIRSQKTV